MTCTRIAFYDINSGTFGRVTARSTTSNNNRIVVLGARINF